MSATINDHNSKLAKSQELENLTQSLVNELECCKQSHTEVVQAYERRI